MVQNWNRVKVVWLELNQIHTVVATPSGEENGFLKFQLLNGNSVLLSRAAIVKIEELG
jgi:hypothetical protein